MKSLLIFALVLSATLSTFAQKQGLGGLKQGQLQKCLSMATNNDLLSEVSRRMSFAQQPPQYPAPTSTYTCMMIDSGYSKTFVAKGSTKLQAEAELKKSCAESVHPSYCNSEIRCAQQEQGTRGYFCLLTDTGYSKTFSAEGTDIIEAEAKTKVSCQNAVHPSYCAKAPIKCEPIY